MTGRTSRRRLAAVLAVAAAGLLATACGSGRSGLTAVEQNQLLGLIGQARTAAAAGHPAAAQTALTELRSTVSQLRVDGVLDPARAARMQSVAAQAQSAARAQAAAAAAAAVATQAPAVPSAPAAPAPAPAPTGPVQTIIQGANDLKGRVDKGVGKIKAKINQLRQTLAGQGQGGGGGGGGD